MMNTVLGLLIKGDINCAGGPVDPNGDLFSSQKPSTSHSTTDQRPARQATDIPAGVIRTEAESRRPKRRNAVSRKKRSASSARKSSRRRKKRSASVRRIVF